MLLLLPTHPFTFVTILRHCDMVVPFYFKNRKSSPKLYGKSPIATLIAKKWTRPLCVQAAQYPQKTSPITQPLVCYIRTTQTETKLFCCFCLLFY